MSENRDSIVEKLDVLKKYLRESLSDICYTNNIPRRLFRGEEVQEILVDYYYYSLMNFVDFLAEAGVISEEEWQAAVEISTKR